MNYSKMFRVKPGGKVDLAKADASFTDAHASRDSVLPELMAFSDKLGELQYRLYAQRERALLICLEGRDASGKDGVIKHLMAAMNPQGCTVADFDTYTGEQDAHDFLWCAHRAAPARGRVAIFNHRSYYRDLMAARVDDSVPKAVWSKRYTHVNNFEKMLYDQGTVILKFFLHIDPDEQLDRLRRRIDDRTRHWCIRETQYTQRLSWNAYTASREIALGRCSTEQAPWFVIPANKPWFRDLAVARIVVETLDSLEMRYPPPAADIGAIKARYHALAEPFGGESPADAEAQAGTEWQPAEEEQADAKKEKKKKKGRK